MHALLSFLLLFLLFLHSTPQCLSTLSELQALMAMKTSLDPQSQFLTSWTPHSDPCSDQAFEGVACNEHGLVTNISLQGKGLWGQIPSSVGELKSLTGLYLHFNALSGRIPEEVAGLDQLSDLYLNVNNISGSIPRQIGNMSNLQVLQLCYNKLTGGIPTELGHIRSLTVLALQSNQLTGAIPASLGELAALTRLDLSFNSFFGPIPSRLADAPMLQVLDVRSNILSGNVPPALRRLDGGFLYENNPRLCGVGFSDLNVCNANAQNPTMPQPFEPNNVSPNDLPFSPPAKDIPESANVQSNCSQSRCAGSSKSSQVGIVLGVIGVLVAVTVTGLFTLSWYRRRKQKIGNSLDTFDSRLSTDQAKEVYKKSVSPLISLEYSSGWDPLAKGNGGYSQEVLESFMFNLEEVQRATHSFSELNLLRKNNFSSVYKGILRDGSVVAVNCIGKTSCKSDEADFLKGLKILTSLKHENLVRLRGFCCSKGRGEWFLIYDFVPNESLLQYLDTEVSNGESLDWSTRVSIINGIAKGIGYLHGNIGNKPAIVHQSISAEKVLIDSHYNPLLSDSGLHKLLADDIIYSMLKPSAAMGYLAPEYVTTGRLTGKSDVYAFGMIVFQILSGKRKIAQSTRQGAEAGKFEDFVDVNLEGSFSESEASKLGRIALRCTQESPNHRPTMESVISELSEFIWS